MLNDAKSRQRLAAVVLLVRGAETSNPELLLVKRASHLNSHAGEVGLPGGMAEPSDRDLWHTALREAEEEVGLAAHSVRLQQPLAHAYTRRGVEVAPFVAHWYEEHSLTLCDGEIESFFWLPLAFLKRDERVRTDIFSRSIGGSSSHSVNHQANVLEHWAPVYRYAEQIIWGFTARLLVDYMNTCHNSAIGRSHRAPEARIK
ncbi:MAG: hypothetical protein RL497_829 [Pseudomonadota bacterium]|jgi:8-oxo-dGTP pyrophosphatase MutT (NUDIX family)